MKNLIKSFALVGVLTVIGAGPTQAAELIQNGTFTANASSFVSLNGVIGTQWGNPASISSWSTAPTGSTSWWGVEGAGTSVGTALGPANTGGRTYSFSYWSGGTTWLYQYITTFAASKLYRISYDIACSQVSSANYQVGALTSVPSGSLLGVERAGP